MQTRINHVSDARLDADEIYRQATAMRAEFIKSSVRNLISGIRGHAVSVFSSQAAAKA
ncbi:hypothetical protein SAMN04490244_1042 [Tranquillimonas rosea]|uniref:Uncharacterized protein n=1 Tax=Tranquillimonas rosea TaxID=641238 RepID=A0A1H9T792_9RHOB|nr:hypothetical protein [Tranquillimonas rosea]SER92996.1 hypothetical protein SAMN04490244_1042 [Tranquillimonas rosea]